MRNTKLWAVLLAFVLLCGCVLGILFTGVSAEGEVVYGVGYTEGVDEDKQFDTFQAAFAAVETAIANGEWTEGNTLVIKFAGNLEGKVEDSELLFGQKTIFTSAGKKLPITILGTEESDASTIKVSAEKIACANDYTFKDLTLDLHSYVVGTATFDSTEYNVGVSFFAGSGNVTLNNVATFHLGSHVFGDNYTAEVFEGWTEADAETLKDEDGCLLSSVTFTDTGFVSTGEIGKTSTNSIDAGPCAVGATRNSETGEDAYAAVISENLTITPADTKAMLEVTSGTITSRLGGYMAQYPARVHTAIIKVTGGSVGSIAGDEAGGHVGNKIENGNVEVIAENCTLSGTGLRILYGGGSTITDVSGENKYGNVTVQAKNLAGSASHYIGGSDNLEVAGKVTVTLDSCNAGKRIGYIGLYGARGVEVNISNATLTEYSATRISAASKTVNCEIKNTLTNVIYDPVPASSTSTTTYNLNPTGYRAHNSADAETANFYVEKLTNVFTGCTFKTKDLYALGSATDVGSVSTVIDSCTFEYDFYNSSDSTTASPTVGNVTTTVRETVEGVSNSFPGDDFWCIRSGTEVTGDVVNNIEGGTFDVLYGVFKKDVGGTITNNISGITVTTFYGLYDYDSTNKVALNHTYGGGVTTKVGDDTVATTFTTAYYATLPSLTTTVKGTAYDADTGKGIKIDTFYGARYDTVSGEVSTVVDGGTINTYYGTSNGSAATVKNTVKAGQLGSGKYYGAYNTRATRVENRLQGGSIANIRGTEKETVGSVLNSLTGANTNGYNGTYSTTVTDKVETKVTAGTHNTLYVIYGGDSATLGDLVTEISGGTITGDVLLGGYGGKSVKSVTNTISGTVKFTGSGKMLACATGNKNWTGQVLGDVVNNFEGGTFSCIVYGGAHGGCIQGNIYNNVKSGTFKNVFYGGNCGPTYYRSDKTYYNSYLNKGVEGTIYNVVGEEDKPETAPVFEKTFYGGDCGVIADNAYANKSNCTIENTVYNGIFTSTYYGGNAKNAYISKQIDLEPYSITLNVTNNIHNGTFLGSFFGGSASAAHDATEGTTIAAGVSGGTITNNLYKADIALDYLGGIGTGSTPMTIDLVNNFWDVTLRNENNYLGHGAKRPTTGTITNTFYEGFNADTAYVYGAGAGVVNAPEGKTVAVTNVINGGNFTGFWGAGGNANLILNADVETIVYGGTFNVYSSSSINGIAGGTRNGTLNGKATLNIYDGTFIGQVCGGTYLGDTSYSDRLITGSTELNIYGGNFKRSIFPCSPTATIYATEGSTLNIAQTEGKELAFYATVGQCDSFEGNGEAIKIGKNTKIVAENVSGTVSLNQTQGWLQHDYFTIVSGTGEFGEITTASGAFGKFATKAYVVGEDPAYVMRVYGVGTVPVATSLILDQKLTVRVLFDPAEVASYGKDFTFAAVMGENTLDTVFEEYTVDGVTYASYLIKGIGLGNFTELIEISGAALDTMDFSVVSLADGGAEYYETKNEIYAQLFKSIADLGRKANEQEALYGAPVTEAVNWTASKAPEAVDSDRLSMNTIGLVMNDAIGIRLTGETVAADTPLQFWVNGVNVTSSCVITRSETADETSGKFGFTVDMYVKVSRMTSELNIVITDDTEAAMFTMTVRVDALAEQIYEINETEITNYALAYIQAADAYVKA